MIIKILGDFYVIGCLVSAIVFMSGSILSKAIRNTVLRYKEITPKLVMLLLASSLSWIGVVAFGSLIKAGD